LVLVRTSLCSCNLCARFRGINSYVLINDSKRVHHEVIYIHSQINQSTSAQPSPADHAQIYTPTSISRYVRGGVTHHHMLAIPEISMLVDQSECLFIRSFDLYLKSRHFLCVSDFNLKRSGGYLECSISSWMFLDFFKQFRSS
jgi:hypothetical protein